LADQFPHLKALIEARHPKSGRGRMIIIGVFLIFGLLAAASKSGKYTLPFMIMVLVVIFFFKRFERFFSGSETAWKNFRDNVEGTPLDAQLPQLEAEFAGESTEWADIMMTDSFLLWPREIEQRKIVQISDITSVYLDRTNEKDLLCDTRTIGNELLVSTDEAEIREIIAALLERRPTLDIDQDLVASARSIELDDDE
jgi:hypothetical protein